MIVNLELNQGIMQAKQEHFLYCQKRGNREKIGTHFKELAVCQSDIICTATSASQNIHQTELHKIFTA